MVHVEDAHHLQVKVGKAPRCSAHGTAGASPAVCRNEARRGEGGTACTPEEKEGKNETNCVRRQRGAPSPRRGPRPPPAVRRARPRRRHRCRSRLTWLSGVVPHWSSARIPRVLEQRPIFFRHNRLLQHAPPPRAPACKSPGCRGTARALAAPTRAEPGTKSRADAPTASPCRRCLRRAWALPAGRGSRAAAAPRRSRGTRRAPRGRVAAARTRARPSGSLMRRRRAAQRGPRARSRPRSAGFRRFWRRQPPRPPSRGAASGRAANAFAQLPFVL